MKCQQCGLSEFVPGHVWINNVLHCNVELSPVEEGDEIWCCSKNEPKDELFYSCPDCGKDWIWTFDEVSGEMYWEELVDEQF